MSIHAFFGKDAIDLPGLAAHLDALSNDARITEARELGPRQQAQLFEATQDARPIRLSDFVPEGAAPLAEVIHYGRNTLPLFKHFQKRFCRPSEGSPELWGYNEQTMRWATGPGYFIAKPSGEREVVIDYYDVPASKPASWPEIKANTAGLSRFVYKHTRDFMRAVSKHVSIGRASRDGKVMDNWFVLCRGE